MSEFMEKHSVTIGAPRIRGSRRKRLPDGSRPPSSLQRDSTKSRSHPDVFNVLLRSTTAAMTDGQGRTVDFKNTVDRHDLGIWGLRDSGDDRRVESVKNAVMTEVREHFRPEFINPRDRDLQLARQRGHPSHFAAIQSQEPGRVAAHVTLEVTDEAMAELSPKWASIRITAYTSAQVRDPGLHRESSCDGHARGFRRSRRHDLRRARDAHRFTFHVEKPLSDAQALGPRLDS